MQRRTAKMVIDYQNIHLTGHGIFAPNGVAKHESLVHPLHFANQWLAVRNHVFATQAMAKGEEPVAYELTKIVVYRGLPSNSENPNGYRRNQAQQSEWTRDPRVEVVHRGLRYSWVNGEKHAQEKGVDVLVALDFVRSADRGDADAVILASHDTDLEPALAAAFESGKVSVETAGWKGCRILKVPGQRVWHTSLHGAHFVQARDRKDYT
ncbi:NYN domain-containing protein [Micrococcales bacterium KH10]|nr:NYN domain-containing protein [Micrococcales bacterium KH10]